jgi:AbrB family looped-hinge helix DNA binding protein
METRLSSKGQVILPGAIRRKLGLRPGDSLDASVKSGNIILTPRQPPARAAITRDAITGLLVLSAGPGAPQLTSEQVQDLLSSLP